VPACSVRRRQPGHHHTAFRLGQRIHPGSALIIFPAKARVDVADGTGLRRCDEVVGIIVDPSPIRAAMFNAALSWQPLDLRRAQAVLTQSNQISTGRYAMAAIETINKDAQPGLLDREVRSSTWSSSL